MKKPHLIIFAISFLICVGIYLIPDPQSDVIITERLLAYGDDFDVDDKSTNKSEIVERTFNLLTVFEYRVNKQLVAYSEGYNIQFKTVIKIYDSNKEYIGKIEKEQLESLMSTSTVFGVYDAKDNQIARSRKNLIGRTEFTIEDVNGGSIAEFKRNLSPIYDKWFLTIHNDNFDCRLLYFIPCYKTNNDNKKSND